MRFLPPLNALRAFESAARNKSLTKAASELNVTRAAVSQQVKQLEAYLNAVLFERKGAKLTLTEDAKYYLPLLTQMFEMLSAGTEQLFERNRRDTVTLSVAQSFCSQCLIPLLPLFHQAHPDISLKFSTTSNAFPNGSKVSDVEIVNGINSMPSQEVTYLIKEHWIVVASPGYLQKPTVTIGDIASAEKIATTGYSEGWAYWFEKNGYTGKFNKPCFQFDHSSLAIQSAIQGLGVLLVKDILVQAELNQGDLVQVWHEKVPCLGGHYVICNTPQKESVALFIRWLKAHLSTADNTIHTVAPYE